MFCSHTHAQHTLLHTYTHTYTSLFKYEDILKWVICFVVKWLSFVWSLNISYLKTNPNWIIILSMGLKYFYTWALYVWLIMVSIIYYRTPYIRLHQNVLSFPEAATPDHLEKRTQIGDCDLASPDFQQADWMQSLPLCTILHNLHAGQAFILLEFQVQIRPFWTPFEHLKSDWLQCPSNIWRNVPIPLPGL